MSPSTTLHSWTVSIWLWKHFRLHLMSDCTLHFYCGMHCIFSIGLRFVRRPWIGRCVTSPYKLSWHYYYLFIIIILLCCVLWRCVQMQNQQITCQHLVGPPHLVLVDDPYLMRGVLVVESVAEGCHLSCHRLMKGLYRTDDRLPRHTQVRNVASKHCNYRTPATASEGVVFYCLCL